MTETLPYKLPFVASDQLRLTRFGPEGATPTIYLFADVLDEIIRHAAWRPEEAATLLVGARYQGPEGPYLELQGFAESAYVSKVRDLVGHFQQGHPRTWEQLEEQGEQHLVGWSLDQKRGAARASGEAWRLHRTFFNLPGQLFLALDTADEVLAIYRMDEEKNPFSVGFYLISRADQPMPFGERTPAEEPPEDEALPELDVRDNAWAGALALPREERTRTTRAIFDEEEEDAPHSPVPVLPGAFEEDPEFEVEDEELPRQTMIARALVDRDDEEPLAPRGGFGAPRRAMSDDELDDLLLESVDSPPRQTMIAHALMDHEDSAEDALGGAAPARDTWIAHARLDPEEDDASLDASLAPSQGEDTYEAAIPALASELGEPTSEGWNFMGEGERKQGALRPMPGRAGYPAQAQQRPAFVTRQALPATESGDEEAPPEAAVLRARLNKIKQLRTVQERSSAPPRREDAPHKQGGDDGHDS